MERNVGNNVPNYRAIKNLIGRCESGYKEIAAKQILSPTRWNHDTTNYV